MNTSQLLSLLGLLFSTASLIMLYRQYRLFNAARKRFLKHSNEIDELLKKLKR